MPWLGCGYAGWVHSPAVGTVLPAPGSTGTQSWWALTWTCGLAERCWTPPSPLVRFQAHEWVLFCSSRLKKKEKTKPQNQKRLYLTTHNPLYYIICVAIVSRVDLRRSKQFWTRSPVNKELLLNFRDKVRHCWSSTGLVLYVLIWDKSCSPGWSWISVSPQILLFCVFWVRVSLLPKLLLNFLYS